MKNTLAVCAVAAAMAVGLHALANVAAFDSRIAADAAQASKDGFSWKDAAAFPLESKVCASTATSYGRIPADMMDMVPAGVRAMAGHSTGHYFLLETDSPKFGVRWKCKQTSAADPYIPPQGMYGVDIYMREGAGWRFLKNGRLGGGDGWEETRVDLPGDGTRRLIVYLPIRAELLGVELGVVSGRRLAPCGHESGVTKPVVHYGTSLVHGGCASRPGLVFTSQAARLLDVPYVNLGFSGCARLEPAMADVMARADASLYVVDTVWNCSDAQIRERAEPFLRRLHSLRPGVPILLCEGPEASGSRHGSNIALKSVYNALVKDGSLDGMLSYLPAAGMLPGGDATHDYIHPNDSGSAAMAAVFAAAIAEAAGLPPSVHSPNGETAFAVHVDGKLRYDLSYRGSKLISDSALGFDFKGEKPMASGFELLGRPSVEEGLVEAWTPVVANRHSSVRLVYNRMTLRLREKGGDRRRMDLTVNAYDDGVAFRYTLYGSAKLGERRIVEERTEYRVPETSFAWVGRNAGGGPAGSQESRFERKPVKDMGAWCLMPLLVEVDGGNYLALTSAALDGYPGYLASWRDGAIATSLVPAPEEGGDGGVKARFCERFDTAWRVILVGDTPGRFVESEIIRAVNPPCAIADTSWIRPGISAWDHWWSGDVKMDMDVIKEYIDLAAAQGWPYMLVDWQWYGRFNYPGADITKPAPQIDIHALVAYAKERGVRLWLWLYSSDVTRNDAFRDVFPVYAKWGIAGVKIDFMDRYDSEIVGWYRRIAACAAENRLMLDFHGACAPDGIERTYPNVLTREGVLGEEYSKFSDAVTPGHNVTLAFTRMIAGPMDYTPGGFLNVAKADFRKQSPTLVMNTRTAELAKFVVYESPLTVFCEHPRNVIGKAGAEFLREVPTTWDDTRFLGGYPDQYVAIARRSGGRWYVAVMGGDDARRVEIDLSAIGVAGRYRYWKDGASADETASGLAELPKNGRLSAELAPGGGFVAVFP